MSGNEPLVRLDLCFSSAAAEHAYRRVRSRSALAAERSIELCRTATWILVVSKLLANGGWTFPADLAAGFGSLILLALPSSAPLRLRYAATVASTLLRCTISAAFPSTNSLSAIYSGTWAAVPASVLLAIGNGGGWAATSLPFSWLFVQLAATAALQLTQSASICHSASQRRGPLSSLAAHAAPGLLPPAATDAVMVHACASIHPLLVLLAFCAAGCYVYGAELAQRRAFVHSWLHSARSHSALASSASSLHSHDLSQNDAAPCGKPPPLPPRGPPATSGDAPLPLQPVLTVEQLRRCAHELELRSTLDYLLHFALPAVCCLWSYVVVGWR